MFGDETKRLLDKHPPSNRQFFSFAFVTAIVFFTFAVYSSGSAKRYEMDGVITKITWGCTSRYHIPTITYKDINGKEIVLCYDSIALTRKDIKVGDHIVKKKGSYTAMVNGREVKFAH